MSNMTLSHKHNRTDPQINGVEFYNNKTAPFWVNGSALPDVYFDIGESYAGLLPIDDTKELYFWFVPTTNPAASDEITIWWVDPDKTSAERCANVMLVQGSTVDPAAAVWMASFTKMAQ